MIDYPELLSRSFPLSSFPNTIRALREGIAIADDAIKGTPFLDNPIGRDLRGFVRRAGVMFRMHQLCTAGDLPFRSNFSPMPIGNWHWLELKGGTVRAHLVRTDHLEAFPDDTPNRQDQRATNQPDLFDDRKIVPISGSHELYAWLCYGVTRNGAITHALWSMPSASGETWLARNNILRTAEAMAAEARVMDVPKHDVKDVMSFRESLREVIEKQETEKPE